MSVGTGYGATYSSTDSYSATSSDPGFSALDPDDSNLATSSSSPTSSGLVSAYQAGVQGGGGNTAGSTIASTFANELEAGFGELSSSPAKAAEDLGGVNTNTTSVLPIPSNAPTGSGLISGSWTEILIIAAIVIVGGLVLFHYAND
jgi:hypothetical protein